jgi:2-polyprenyl-3-methyl-5-hydroxy-6-metoxy-1,4-benzoquinol methylase
VHTDNELVELQQTLYSSRNPTRRWLHCSRREWIQACIARQRMKINRALEIGPGSGIYIPVLAEVAGEVVVADIEEAYLDQAREFVPRIPKLQCIRDDITNTWLPGASFDLILCTEVIEHIEDSPAALVGLASLLAPGGTLILTTPQRYSPLELCAKVAFLPGVIQLVRLIYREPIIPTGHINLLTEDSLRAQIAAADLEVRAHYKLGFYLPIIAEAGGETGQKLLQWCEGKLRYSRLSWLLWTQCYVLARPALSRATV